MTRVERISSRVRLGKQGILDILVYGMCSSIRLGRYEGGGKSLSFGQKLL